MRSVLCVAWVGCTAVMRPVWRCSHLCMHLYCRVPYVLFLGRSIGVLFTLKITEKEILQESTIFPAYTALCCISCQLDLKFVWFGNADLNMQNFLQKLINLNFYATLSFLKYSAPTVTKFSKIIFLTTWITAYFDFIGGVGCHHTPFCPNRIWKSE